MKTKADLNNLILILVDMLMKNDHEIGSTFHGQDEDWGCHFHDYKDNYLCYEEDGWLIEITYKCCGEWDNDPGDYWNPPCCELNNAWGKVTEILASHFDEDTDEETEFSDDDLKELWLALDKELEDIA